MVVYTSQYQTKITEFNNLYNLQLNTKNRWLQLGAILPWDNLVKIFALKYSNKGTKTINPRFLIGAVLVKHLLNLGDQETINTIQENPYIQFFLGLDSFNTQALFSPSLFVEVRKKLGKESFDAFSDELIKICCADKIVTPSERKEESEQEQLPNKGKLKLDATVADQYITYPNDLGLLNKSRLASEKMIDLLYAALKDALFFGDITGAARQEVFDATKVKPRTNRKTANQKYLTESKKKQKSIKTLRPVLRYLMNCLDRNIKIINQFLDLIAKHPAINQPLKHKDLRKFWILQTINHQQRKMYNEKSNSCEDRIVSLSQPQVRPIVRGKQGKKVEFGSKIGLTLANGFAKAETLSWDNYNENADLIIHAESYKALYGYYPELIQVDKIYPTNENRKWCKERNIRLTAKPKGKPKKLSKAQIKKRKKEYNERNAVEGKIGQAKQGYGLNKIKARLQNTSEAWIGAILFAVNIIKFAEYNGFSF